MSCLKWTIHCLLYKFDDGSAAIVPCCSTCRLIYIMHLRNVNFVDCFRNTEKRLKLVISEKDMWDFFNYWKIYSCSSHINILNTKMQWFFKSSTFTWHQSKYDRNHCVTRQLDSKSDYFKPTKLVRHDMCCLHFLY